MTLSASQTFPICVGLLDPRHVQAIGRAVWVYLWFLNRVTRDEQHGAGDFVGIVLNGRPLSIEEIAEELGFDYHACRRQVAHLVKTGYVERQKTGAGMFTYAVTKSKKWAWKRRPAGARSRRPISTGKQANLFPPSDGPTEQKMLSGSQDPHDKNCSVGADPQSRKCNSTEQNLSCAESGSRARSQETTKYETTHTGTGSVTPVDEWVLKIAAEHPKLVYLKGRPLTQPKEYAIAEAIARDGPEVVLAGTRRLGDVPDEKRRYIADPVKFYRESKYLPDAPDWDTLLEKPSTYKAPEKLPADYESPSAQMTRQYAGVIQ